MTTRTIGRGRGSGRPLGTVTRDGSRDDSRPASRDGCQPGNGGQAGAADDPGHLVGLERRPADEGAVDRRLGEELADIRRRDAPDLSTSEPDRRHTVRSSLSDDCLALLGPEPHRRRVDHPAPASDSRSDSRAGLRDRRVMSRGGVMTPSKPTQPTPPKIPVPPKPQPPEPWEPAKIPRSPQPPKPPIPKF